MGKTTPTCCQLKRSDKYKSGFREWQQAQVYLNWTHHFFKSYHYVKASLTHQYRVQIISEESHRGAILFYDPKIGADNFSFLFDLLKERVQQQSYRLHSADQHLVRHKRYTELSERYLLTPPASDVPGTALCNQLYGNVQLDYIKVNNHPGYIRFTTNPYTDSYFSKPLPFDHLLEKVLQPQEQRRD
ncbi:hypothetical protein [Pontibacter vulgaris]|uniref:hypothetical protein n=1 Tax=Pontibacter vulgaris TaxID=2905679 RepID=UPI001FA73E3B|nr:hypothetical protein [Pontibacter vulgaris]